MIAKHAFDDRQQDQAWVGKEDSCSPFIPKKRGGGVFEPLFECHLRFIFETRLWS